MTRFFLIIALCCLFHSNLTFSEDRPDGAKTFNFGVVIPLTGDLADYGSAIRNGFELAKREFPERFNFIRFLYEDSRYDGKVAVSALHKLMATGEINLYYLWGVSPTEATLPIAAQHKLPVIAETTMKEATVGKPLVVRAARTGERIASALTAEIMRRGAKSVSFVTTDIPFYIDIRNHLEKKLISEGVIVVSSREVLPTESDFKNILLEKDLQRADLVGAFLLPSQLISFFRQSYQAKQSLRVFNADILDSQSIVDACPENINGTFFTQVGVTPEFRRRYLLAYGSDTQIGSAAQAYDVANILGELFNSAAAYSLTSDKIIEKVSRMAPRTGATGAFQYSENKDSGKEIRMPVSIKVVRNKKIETLVEDTGY